MTDVPALAPAHTSPPLLQLLCAALQQDAHDDVVDALLAKATREGIDARDERGDTLLTMAATFRRTDVVIKLLDAGADADLPNTDSHTPLMIAATKADVATIDVLLKHGADVLLTDATGRTAINFAFKLDCVDAINVLIAAGAVLDDQAQGSVLLTDAVWSRAANTLEKLLQDGVTAMVEDPGSVTPLMAAASGAHVGMVRSLLSVGARANSVCNNGCNALICASTQNEEVVQLLLATGVDVDHTDRNGMSALHFATGKDKPSIVDMLIANGANVDCCVDVANAMPPLSVAVVRGHKTITEALILAGANVDLKDAGGMTALCHAAVQGDIDHVNILLAGGATVDTRVSDGTSALMIATVRGYTRVVERLLVANANVNTTNDEGFTALHLACQLQHQDILASLIAAGADPNVPSHKGLEPIQSAVCSGGKSIVELLLKAGANANSSMLGQSVLMIACSRADIGTVRHLLRQLREYRPPKNPQLLRLYAEARRLGDRLDIRRWTHHVRAHNRMADRLANLAMDDGTSSQVSHPTTRPGHADLLAHLGNDLRPWLALFLDRRVDSLS